MVVVLKSAVYFFADVTLKYAQAEKLLDRDRNLTSCYLLVSYSNEIIGLEMFRKGGCIHLLVSNSDEIIGLERAGGGD